MGRCEETDKAVNMEQREVLVLSTLHKTWVFDLVQTVHVPTVQTIINTE